MMANVGHDSISQMRGVTRHLTSNLYQMRLRLFLFFICVISFFSCTNEKKGICVLDNYPIEHCKLSIHRMDSVLIYPQSINVFKDKLLVMEPQRDVSKISVFGRDSFKFQYSGIDAGRARYEAVSLRHDYYACTDTSFFLLDNNVEKEYCFKDGRIEYVGCVPIAIPDALNQLLRVGTGKYIASGFSSGKGHEHLLYENGRLDGFGEYPETYSSSSQNFILNAKVSAGLLGKDRIWDFYLNHNLIRSYDLEGNLLLEMKIENSAQKTNITDPHDCEFYFYGVKWNARYMAVLYNEKYSWLEFYLSEDAEQRTHELQLWTWDGELKRRIRFDKHFDFYALSDDDVFYAMDAEQPDVIYTYDFNEK